MKKLLEVIPQHVREFLEQQDSTIAKGIERINQLKTIEDHMLFDMQISRAEKTARILRGYAFVAAQQNLKSGEFTAYLTQINVPRSTAYDYIKEARSYTQLPDSDSCVALARLGSEKARLLEKLPKETVTGFLQGKPLLSLTYDDALEMHAHDFKKIVHECRFDHDPEMMASKKAIAELNTKLDTAQTELQALKKKRNGVSEYPEFVVNAREESLALSDKALLCIDDLERIGETLSTLSKDPEIKDQDVSVAASTLCLHAEAVAKRAAQVAKIMRAGFHGYVGDDTPAALLYTPDELETALATRNLMTNQHAHEKLLRIDARERAKPKGRGRPKNPAVKK